MNEKISTLFKDCKNMAFITIADRGEQKSPYHKKIGWASDRGRLISDTMFVVKILGKNDEPCFFILANLKKKIHEGWFQKGVHIHIQKPHMFEDVCRIVNFMLGKNDKWAQYENYQIIIGRFNKTFNQI